MAASDSAHFRVDTVEVPPGIPIEECPGCGARVCRIARKPGVFVLVSLVEPFELPTTLMPLHPCPGALAKLQRGDRRTQPPPSTNEPLTEPSSDEPVAELCPAFSPRGQDRPMKTPTRGNATHHCAAPRCLKKVPFTQLMCSAHWFKVPKDLRDLIWKLYRAVEAGDEDSRGLHRRACADAVQAVEDSERDADGGDA